MLKQFHESKNNCHFISLCTAVVDFLFIFVSFLLSNQMVWWQIRLCCYDGQTIWWKRLKFPNLFHAFYFHNIIWRVVNTKAKCAWRSVCVTNTFFNPNVNIESDKNSFQINWKKKRIKITVLHWFRKHLKHSAIFTHWKVAN